MWMIWKEKDGREAFYLFSTAQMYRCVSKYTSPNEGKVQ